MTPAIPPRSNAPRSGWWQLALLWVLVPAFVVVLALTRFEWQYQDRIYPGVQALGIDLSGMDQETAAQRLAMAAQVYDLPPLALRHGDQVWPLKAEELGVKVNVEDTLAQAFAWGRNGDIFENLNVQMQAFWQGQRQYPQLAAQPGAVTGAVAGRTAHLNQSVTEPKLSLSDLQVVISTPRSGQIVDVEATRNEVLDRVSSGRGGVVDVIVHELSATQTDVSAGREAIEQLLDEPIVLADTFGEFQFALDPATLAEILDWVADENMAGGLRAEVNQEELVKLVDTWAQQVARPPLNARFDFNENLSTLVELSPSADGYALDTEATIAGIISAIETGQTHIDLPVELLHPAVASDDIGSLGIKELVVAGRSNFAGSSEARIRNIEVAASKFVGVVVPPSEMFSFNEHIGDVTAANGFEDSLIIAGDRTAVGVGGGVCQVSTTVFRAAWRAGFPIEERWNHGYVVSWYGNPGLDATIYTPTVDFKFRNTTDHHLLIKPIVDSENGVLTYKFFGTKPDWQVELEKPVQKKFVPAPAPLYIEDLGLPKGKVVQFDWAVQGMDTIARRKVIAANGTVLLDEKLDSHYLPWQAKYRFGPGFVPPENAEVQRVEEPANQD